MKRLLSVLLISIFFFSIATAGEIAYFNRSWDEVRSKAKIENKYIMVDCYTGWCSWCKVMDKETMIQPDVINMINDKFVAVKMDMEHGEGIKLAMKYHITGYPTFMFFNPNGELVYLSIGYQKPKEFSDELKNALDKSKQLAAPGYSTNINMDFPALYQNAFGERGKTKFPETAEVTAFLDQQKDLYSEVSWSVLSRFTLDDKYTTFFFHNMPKYQELYGSASVDNKVNSILMSRERAAVKSKNNTDFEGVLQLVDRYMKKDKEETKLSMRMDYYKAIKDWDKFMTAFADIVKMPGYDDPNYINSQCWALYEQCDDKKILTKACAYMADAVAKEPRYANMDTYAAILYKSGKTTEAGMWANKAIAEGKKEGEKTDSTDELLKKIKAAHVKNSE